MTLRDLIKTMDDDELLYIRDLGETEFIECTPLEVNDHGHYLLEKTVTRVWVSKNLYMGIMISVE
jgi:hypothetical protein